MIRNLHLNLECHTELKTLKKVPEISRKKKKKLLYNAIQIVVAAINRLRVFFSREIYQWQEG